MVCSSRFRPSRSVERGLLKVYRISPVLLSEISSLAVFLKTFFRSRDHQKCAGNLRCSKPLFVPQNYS